MVPGDVVVMGTLPRLFAQTRPFPSNASLLWAYDFLTHMKAMVEENTHEKVYILIFKDFNDKTKSSVVNDPLRPASGRPPDTWQPTVSHEGLKVCK